MLKKLLLGLSGLGMVLGVASTASAIVTTTVITVNNTTPYNAYYMVQPEQGTVVTAGGTSGSIGAHQNKIIQLTTSSGKNPAPVGTLSFQVTANTSGTQPYCVVAAANNALTTTSASNLTCTAPNGTTLNIIYPPVQ